MILRHALVAGCLLWMPWATLGAMEHVTIRRDGASQEVSGRVLVEAQDGGLLLLDRSGVLWPLQPDEIRERRQDAQPYQPLDRQEMTEQLLSTLPDGFRVHHTMHYLICYNTSSAYAEWCGALYERLYAAFTNYWKHREFEIREPEWPLVALVFSDRASYARYADVELGGLSSSVIGYFSLHTNRVAMYDLTGADGLAGQGSRVTSAVHINRILSRPEAERTVATIIHEATHQVAFNCGLQTRLADIPLWVSEGIAVYFETPDLKSARGWKNIGGVNQVRLFDFRSYLRQRPRESLLTLISSDDRFRDPKTAGPAYGEAWALNYFLLRRKAKEYQQYLQALAAKPPLQLDSPQDRVTQFKAAFGEDLEKLEAEFLKFMREGK